MYPDHDHRGEYADDRHDHDDRYAEDRHRHYGTEREVDQLRSTLREHAEEIREHAEAIRALQERVRQLESALQPPPDPPVPGESDTSAVEDWAAANWDAAALLPTGKTMNPARPENAVYYDEDQIAYIVTGPAGSTRVLTSFGELNGWTLGSRHEIRHDQTGGDLGVWMVTGIRNYKTGEQAGEVPDRPVRQWVFK